MFRLTHLAQAARLATSSALAVTLVACGGGIEQTEVDNSNIDYQVEERPIDIVADAGSQVPLGETVTLTGRVTGYPIEGIDVLWVQTDGPTVTLNDGYDWSSETIAFDTPETDELGLITYRFELRGVDANGSTVNGTDGEPLVMESAVVAFDPARVLTFEAEDGNVARLIGGATIVEEGDDQFISGASGGGMTADLAPGMAVEFTFTIEAENAGFYALDVSHGVGSGYGGKGAIVTVNGVPNNVFFDIDGVIRDLAIGTFKFDAGEHTVRIGGGWDYYRIDAIKLKPAAAPPAPLAVAPDTVNENATEATKELMAYLAENYTSAILTGQQQAIYDGTNIRAEEDIITAAGGEKPAIYALDYMDYSQTRAEFGSLNAGLTEDTISLREEGQIVTAAWHWNAPMDLVNDGDQPWFRGFYTEASTFDLPTAIADDTSPEYAAIIADLDIIAAELAKLQDANIPVLWRPIHEASGEWFWWGAHGADNYKALWHLMYDYFTNTKGLNNLIWVYTTTDRLDHNWYPGDEYVDIVGYDGYDHSDAGEDNIFQSEFRELLTEYNGRKILALTETGYIPNVDAMAAADVWWSFFVTWYSGSIGNNIGPDDSTMIADVYGSQYAINAVDLPGNISGGASPVGPGDFMTFDSVGNFKVQVDWADVDASGVSLKSEWRSEGSKAFAATIDLPAATTELGATATKAIVKNESSYAAEGMTQIKATVNVANAGSAVTAKFWAKDAGGAAPWSNAVQVPVTDGGVEISWDLVSEDGDSNTYDYSMITEMAIEFEGIDATQTDAVFYVDNFVLVDVDGNETEIDRFERSPVKWEGQVAWGATTGFGVNSDWAADGNHSYALVSDLDGLSESSVNLQTYPEDYFDVSEVGVVSVKVGSANTGSATTAKLFVKDDDGTWTDSGAVMVDGVTTLSIDLDSVTTDGFVKGTLQAIGVQFENFENNDDAAFYLDSVMFDTAMVQHFEMNEGFSTQINWANADVVPVISEMSGESGSNSVVAMLDVPAQIAADGLDAINDFSLVNFLDPQEKISGVASIRALVRVEGAGEGVGGELFFHGADYSWNASTQAAIGNEWQEFIVTVPEGVSDLWSIGMHFYGIDQTATDAKFYIDSIEMLAPAE